MVRLENISLTLGSTKIFDNLSCRIAPGDFVMIVGPNGVGKSSLFNLIAGNIKPDQGRIFIDNQDVTDMPEHKRARSVARLFQNPQLGSVPGMSVRENLALAMLKNQTVSLHEALQQFPFDQLAQLEQTLQYNIRPLLGRPMGKLSGGQRQMIALVMAVLQPPKVLLLDEPTSALDPASATAFVLGARSIINSLGITALMVTHNLQLAQLLGNGLIVMGAGGVAAQFGPEKKALDMHALIPDIDYARLEE